MTNTVVLDTNIWVSIIIGRQLVRLIEAIEATGFVLCRCSTLEKELQEVLMRPKIGKYLTLPIEEYMRLFRKLTIPILTVPIFSSCRDPKDNYLFDIAIACNASYLVSGDKDILTVELTPPPFVIDKRRFEELLAQLLETEHN